MKSFSDTQHQAYTKVLAQNRTEAEAISIAQMVGIGQKVDAYAAALSPYNVANASALQRVAVINDMRMSADSYLRQSVQELLPPGVSRAGALQAAELSGGLPYSDSNSGFASALYRNANTGHYTLAFRGTDDFNLGSVGSVGSMAKNWQLTPDVRASLLQREGLRSTQYDQAVDLASTLAASEIGKKLSFTGHSLGGGLASVAAMSTRLNATTFNASGIHEGTGRLYSFPLRDAPKYVAAYHVIGEGLAASQDAIPSRMPQAIGHRPAYGAAACSTDG